MSSVDVQRTHRRRGQIMVEFALILPLLLVIILGIIEFGRLFYGFSTLQNAVRHAADVASKAPPKVGAAVPDDPEGRYYAAEDPDCSAKKECFLTNIRSAARDYAVLFVPQDPHIRVYFLPVGNPPVVSERVGGLIEVAIEYNIPPITPVLKDIAPLGVPVRVDARRTIVNVEFPYEVVTPLTNPPTDTPPAQTPLPGCGGRYTVQGEQVSGKIYRFQITNVSGGNNRGIVGLVVGWCADLGQLRSVTIGGVGLPGTPVNPPTAGFGGGGITINQGETMVVEMRFDDNLNQLEPSKWPSWHLTFTDYCSLWSTGRECPYPQPTALPAPTPTTTPTAAPTRTPWTPGTVPPLCGMYISSGPTFAGNSVGVLMTNSGNSSPNLSTIVVMWGPGWYPLTEVRWNGQTVWTGTRYYSAYLSGLTGDFPPASVRQVEFIFSGGSVSWTSFQVAFDNDCYVSFSDSNQPTAPPMPTYTPTPMPGWIFLEINNVQPVPPTCATTSFDARATAYYPPAGSNDGNGIQNVVFRIYDPNGVKVYERSDTGAAWCLGSGCNPLSLGTSWPNGGPTVISGTHTLEVTAYTTSGWGSYQRTETMTFQVCRSPMHLEVFFTPSACATDYINVRAVAWDPQVCAGQQNGCQDGEGVNRVYFDVTYNGTLVFRNREDSDCYCAGNGDCPCPNVDFSSGRWPSYGGSEDVGNNPVSSGTHVLTVRVVSTISGRTIELTRAFEVCWNPCTPYVLTSRSKSNDRVQLTLRNKSPNGVWITAVHVSAWPSGWGTLEKIWVVDTSSTVNVNASNPPADATFSKWWSANSNATVTFDFQYSVGDVNAIHGYVELDNGCRIDF